jgi:glycine cleavage system T protein
MGQLAFSGPGVAAFLDRLISSSVGALEENQSVYGLLCREDGGVLDDVFTYRLAEHWLIVVNAANAEKDAGWFAKHLPESGVQMRDISAETAMFALQGPRAIEIADALTDGAATAIPRFGAAALSLLQTPCTVGRTGYTGEDGVEIFLPAARAVEVWTGILGAAENLGIECGPVGLAARDSLRFEPGFALYGHELTEDISPIQARLKWACDLEKDFIGADAIRRQAEEGVSRKLATVKLLEPGVPRQDYRVLAQGSPVGTVASGMYAPTVDAYCANIFVDSPLARTGTEVEIEIRNKARKAVVVKRPLYTPTYR